MISQKPQREFGVNGRVPIQSLPFLSPPLRVGRTKLFVGKVVPIPGKFCKVWQHELLAVLTLPMALL